MSSPGPPDVVVEREGARPSPEGDRSPTLASCFRRRTVWGVLGVILVVGAFAVASRSSAEVTVPDLVGVRVDPRLDTLRLRLDAGNLVLGDVDVGPCPTFDVPGATLEQLPGTIVEQHPAAGANVVVSSSVDVTVCLPGEG
jgi:hypothetical protein